jgi:CO/xanthine dehydrogenase Mo-binding subunit
MIASRREFLKSGGALIVGFSSVAAGAGDAAFAQGPFATQDRRVAAQVDSWLAIGADGRVTAYTGKCELGQGIYTAQTQLVAEELSVPLARVTLIQCDTSVTPDQGTTSGSQSTPTNFNDANLAQACATARDALLRLASERLGVPADQLSVVDGVVGVQGDASRWVGYGELVGGKTFNLTVSSTARRRPAEI